MDVHTQKQRSYNMSRIKGKDTKPEMWVRRYVHKLGFRYRLHGKKLPGRPDIVLPRHKKIIFVNGCFWHFHNCRYGNKCPKTNVEFWHKKRTDTRERDKRNRRDLRKDGWEILTIWECWLRTPGKAEKAINAFLIDTDSMPCEN